MATTDRVAGKGGTTTYAGTTFHVTSWEGEVNAEALETTDSSSGSYREYIPGLVSGTVSADYNIVTTASGMPHDVIPRGNTAAVVLNIGGSGKTLSGSVLITQVRYRNPIDGVASGSFTGNFTGTITEPTG